MTSLIDLGVRLRAERARRRMGLREVAAQLGTSAPTLSRLERGREVAGSVVLGVDMWISGPVGGKGWEDFNT